MPGILLLVSGDEFLHARQVQPVVPGGAEHAEDGVRAQAVDVGPVLLVVDPGSGLVHLELHDLLAQRLDVVATHGRGDHVGLDLLQLEQVGEKSRVFCGTISSSTILPPLASTTARVALAVLWPHT